MTLKGFYFITDHVLTRQGILKDVQEAVAAGAIAVQYRRKEGETGLMLSEARKVREICTNTLFIVNDRVDVALEVGADGVHIGQSDMFCAQARKILGPQRIIGVSVDTLAQARLAQELGADYLGVGPIFATVTKKDAASPCGTQLIRDIKASCSLPVVAIGGITLKNAAEVIEAGADSICAISATVDSTSVEDSIRQFRELFQQDGSI